MQNIFVLDPTVKNELSFSLRCAGLKISNASNREEPNIEVLLIIRSNEIRILNTNNFDHCNIAYEKWVNNYS